MSFALRSTLVVGLVLATFGAFSAAAEASCAPPEDERTRLGQADAAFVGEFVRRSAADQDVLIFRVERDVKGDLGEEVAVRDAHPNSSVSLRPQPNTRVGVLLIRDGAEYESTDCHLLDADALIRAAGTDTAAPLIAIRGPATRSLQRGARIRLRAELSERSAVAVSGRLFVNGRALRGSVHVEQSASTGGRPRPVSITVFIRRHGRAAARAALRRGGSAELVVRGVARDAAGNRASARRTVRLAL